MGFRFIICSMTPTVHFIISIAIAICLNMKISRKAAMIILLGVVGTLPDIDHFLPTIQGAGLFHNTLFMGVVPLAVLIFVHLVETNRENDSSVYQRFFIGVTIILLGHLILDLISGNVLTLGLFSGTAIFSVPNTALLEVGHMGVAFSLPDILWIVLCTVVISGNIVMTKVYNLYEGWETSILEMEAENKLKEPFYNIVSAQLYSDVWA